MPNTADFPTIGTLDETLPATSEPIYQLAALSLTVHKIIKNLSDNNFQFKQAIESDFTTFGTDTQGAIDDHITRYEEFLQGAAASVVADLPDVLPIIGALLSGGSEPVMAILLQGVLDTLLRHKDRRTEEYGGDKAEVDMSSVVTAIEEVRDKLDDSGTNITERLEEVRQQMDSILNEFTINLHDDAEGASWSAGPVGD